MTKELNFPRKFVKLILFKRNVFKLLLRNKKILTPNNFKIHPLITLTLSENE